MNFSMKQKNHCDHAALHASLKSMNISATARRIGGYMVDKLGYEYAIMAFQLRKGLGISANSIEPALQELIDHRFVRQQQRVDFHRSYALDRGFIAAEVQMQGTQEAEVPAISPRAAGNKPKLRLIQGGKA